VNKTGSITTPFAQYKASESFSALRSLWPVGLHRTRDADQAAAIRLHIIGPFATQYHPGFGFLFRPRAFRPGLVDRPIGEFSRILADLLRYRVPRPRLSTDVERSRPVGSFVGSARE